jgi:shikimate kinase
MPGAGKSTIGVLLAKESARDFIDTDVLIQVRESRTLQQIMDESGYLRLRQIEEEVLLNLDLHGHIIATGGSAVYSDKAMARLKQQSLVIFLDASLNQLRQRIHNYHARGIACRPGQSFEALFIERERLYRHYADRIVNCDNKLPEEVLRELVKDLQESPIQGSRSRPT